MTSNLEGLTVADSLGDRIDTRRKQAATAGDSARDDAISAAQQYTDVVKQYLQNWSQNYSEQVRTAVTNYVNDQITQAKTYVDQKIVTLRDASKTYVDNRITKLAADNGLINNP